VPHPAVEAGRPRVAGAPRLQRIHAEVFEWNVASMRVLEKCGYTRVGRLRRSVVKDGKTIDQVLYAILEEECRTRSA
jgi:RimJ/RimL family protein N-acetyltransferase